MSADMFVPSVGSKGRSMPFDAGAARQAVVEPSQLLTRAREVKTRYIRWQYGLPLSPDVVFSFTKLVRGKIEQHSQTPEGPRVDPNERELYYRGEDDSRTYEIRIYRNPQSTSGQKLDTVSLGAFEKLPATGQNPQNVVMKKVASAHISLGDPQAEENPWITLDQSERFKLLDELRREGVDVASLNLMLIKKARDTEKFDPLLTERNLCESDRAAIEIVERILQSSQPLTHDQFYPSS